MTKKPKKPQSPSAIKRRKTDKIGRPTLYQGLNCRIVQKILEGFKNDFTAEESFRYGGIGKNTFYTWLKQHEEFAEAVADAKTYLFIEAKKNVKNAIVVDHDVKVSFELLQTRQRDRYAKRQESMQSEFEPLTDEEELEVQKALKNTGLL